MILWQFLSQKGPGKKIALWDTFCLSYLIAIGSNQTKSFDSGHYSIIVVKIPASTTCGISDRAIVNTNKLEIEGVFDFSLKRRIYQATAKIRYFHAKKSFTYLQQNSISCNTGQNLKAEVIYLSQIILKRDF